MDKRHHDYWKTFYELLTKNYIELAFESRFHTLKKNECPDFKSDDIGLEIVTATTETQNALVSLLRKYMGKKLCDVPDGLLNTLGFSKNNIYQDELGKPFFYITSEQNGVLVLYRKLSGDVILAGQYGLLPNDEFNSKMIVSKINDKILKLNDNYELQNENLLGVYIDNAIIPQEIEYQKEIAYGMQECIQKEIFTNLDDSKAKNFDLIFVCFPDVIYRYDTNSKSFDYVILGIAEISTIFNKTKNDIQTL